MPEERTTSSTGGQKGVKLERHDLIPVGPLQELAVHFGRGAMKYDAHQWRAGYEWSKSYSSIMRHLTSFWSGLDYDVCSNEPDNCQHVDVEGRPFSTGRPDTCYNHLGSHHIVAVAWHAFVLLEFKDTHPDHDDRYIPERAQAQSRSEQIYELALQAFRGYAAPNLFTIDDDMIPRSQGKHKSEANTFIAAGVEYKVNDV